jgi:hypothetical protein
MLVVNYIFSNPAMLGIIKISKITKEDFPELIEIWKVLLQNLIRTVN